MEHTLGEYQLRLSTRNRNGLNPCFNGTYSRRCTTLSNWTIRWSLNPCFNGTYSRSVYKVICSIIIQLS